MRRRAGQPVPRRRQARLHAAGARRRPAARHGRGAVPARDRAAAAPRPHPRPQRRRAGVDRGRRFDLLQPAPAPRPARRRAPAGARRWGSTARELEKKLGQRRFFAWVKRKVTPDEVTAVKALGLPGVAFTREPRRFYPNRDAGGDDHGPRGLGGQRPGGDRAGAGQAAARHVVVGAGDARRAGPRHRSSSGPVDGPERSRQRRRADHRSLPDVHHRARAGDGRGGAPRQGRRRGGDGSAHRRAAGDGVGADLQPQRSRRSAAEAGARNRAITDAFEPGSTMKTFTIAAALEAGVVKPDDRFDCLMGRMMVGKYTIHDTHPHGVADRGRGVQVLEQHRRHEDRAQAGRDGLAEALGAVRLRPADRRRAAGRARRRRAAGRASGATSGSPTSSFGQGLTVTPLQMVAGVSRDRRRRHLPPAANRRARRAGRRQRRDAAGGAPERRVMAPAAARTMLAHHARRDRDRAARRSRRRSTATPSRGKTGTAQKVANGHYDPTKWVSSFVGFVAGRGSAAGDHGDHRRAAGRAPGRRGGGADLQGDRRAGAALPARPADDADRGEGGGEAGGAGEADRERRAAGGGDATPTVDEAPATDLPLDDDALGDDPALAEKWDEVAGAEGGRAERRARRAGRRARLRGPEPRAGDPRRAQERRRAGLRRSGRARDRRGAPPAAGARPGTAGCGLPRGVRAQGMTAPGVHARAACWRASTARACAATRAIAVREVRDDSRRGEPGDLFVAVPGHGGRRAPVPRATRSARGAAALVVEGEPPAELAFPGAVAAVAERAARAGRHRAQPLSGRGGR